MRLYGGRKKDGTPGLKEDRPVICHDTPIQESTPIIAFGGALDQV